jgi:hypothetical protein
MPGGNPIVASLRAESIGWTGEVGEFVRRTVGNWVVRVEEGAGVAAVSDIISPYGERA